MIMKEMVVCMAVLSVAMSGCDSSIPPADTVELYFGALEAKDAEKLTLLSCDDYVEQSLLILDSFTSVEIKISDLDCSELENDGANALVHCNGSLIASYNAENQILDLSYSDYMLTKNRGEWLVCGQK